MTLLISFTKEENIIIKDSIDNYVKMTKSDRTKFMDKNIS